jgi:hypothetical protein
MTRPLPCPRPWMVVAGHYAEQCLGQADLDARPAPFLGSLGRKTRRTRAPRGPSRSRTVAATDHFPPVNRAA